jgi:outer membrane immunogenic protein
VAYGWSGFYFGFHVGYGRADVDSDTTHLPSQALFDASPFSQGARATGLLGGIQIGYNSFANGFLFGFEADWSYSDISGSSSVAPLLLFDGTADAGSSQRISTSLDWFGTARLRLGGGFGDGIIGYVTGGVAFGKVNYGVVTDYVGDLFRYPGSESETKIGWTAGFGVEMGLGSAWSFKAEYLYFDLGSAKVVADPVAANPPFQVRTDFDMTGQIVRLGLNYRFGGAAVVTRY